MDQAIEKLPITIDFSVETPHDLFRAFAFLGLCALKASQENKEYKLADADLLKMNLQIAEIVKNLWQIADQNEWDNIFTSNVISQDTLTLEKIQGAITFGDGLWIPIVRMAGNMISHYPGLIWDTTAPQMPPFIKSASFYVGGTAEQDESLAEIILTRLEAQRDSAQIPPQQKSAHDASNWQLAQILLDSNLKGEDRRHSTENHFVASGYEPKFSAACAEDMLRSPLECDLYERLNNGEPITSMVILLSARLDYKNAEWKWAGDSIALAQARAKATETRALQLLPAQNPGNSGPAIAGPSRVRPCR